MLVLCGTTKSTPSGGKPHSFPFSLLFAVHTDILVPLSRTDILVSLGVTLSGAPISGGAQTGGRGQSVNVAFCVLLPPTPPPFTACACSLVEVLSVTAGNWLSQHGGRSSTGRETVLSRRQKPYPPVCCLHRVVK